LEIYPADLEAIIVRALSSDPAGRFETAEDLRLALEHWIVKSGNVVTPSDIARVVRRRLNPERRQTIEALRHTNKSRLLALAERASRELEDYEVTQTPTASSGLVLRPDELSMDSRTFPGQEPCTPGFSPGSTSTIGEPESSLQDGESQVRRSAPPARAGSRRRQGDEPAVSLPPVPSPVPSAGDRYVPMDQQTVGAGSAAEHVVSAPSEPLVPTTPPGPALRKRRRPEAGAPKSPDAQQASADKPRQGEIGWIVLVLIVVAVMMLLALGI
jgi:hypothetical protein